MKILRDVRGRLGAAQYGTNPATQTAEPMDYDRPSREGTAPTGYQSPDTQGQYVPAQYTTLYMPSQATPPPSPPTPPPTQQPTPPVVPDVRLAELQQTIRLCLQNQTMHPDCAEYLAYNDACRRQPTHHDCIQEGLPINIAETPPTRAPDAPSVPWPTPYDQAPQQPATTPNIPSNYVVVFGRPVPRWALWLAGGSIGFGLLLLAILAGRRRA